MPRFSEGDIIRGGGSEIHFEIFAALKHWPA